ncbi:unnamed protein product [Ilex paraguariensis]|uniref:GAT domain-containing protein n=1 Tax=Ilex paraguariensis TaxID=185542 RepID=A0ABC8T3I0_9AQUA
MGPEDLIWRMDDLTATLVQQCHQSQVTVQRIIVTTGDNDALLFEVLNVNDEIQKVLSKYEEMNKSSGIPEKLELVIMPIVVKPDESPHLGNVKALIRKPVGSRGGALGGSNDDMMDDLDEMILGKKAGGTSEVVHDTKNQQTSPKDDLISF